MSIYDQISISVASEEESRSVARSLARCHQVTPVTILLSGDLGAGKTTFTQAFAQEKGIQTRISSPTFALEQRLGEITHIDLYRLSREQADNFLWQSDWHEGIRIIEWPERL